MALALLMMLTVPAMPARGLNFEEWVPGLTATPFLSERLEYESNVFQTPTGTKGSMISRTTPGLLVEYGRGALQVGAGVRAEFVEYFNVSGQDTVNYAGVAQAKLGLGKLQLLFRDDYIQTTSPPGTELTGPVQSSTNTFAPTAEYRLTDRVSLGANYTWTHVHFTSSTSSSSDSGTAASVQTQQNQAVQQLDRNDQLGGVTAFWKALPNADIGLGYQYGSKSFDNASNRNATIQIVSAQLRGDLTSKLSSTTRIGILHRNEVHGVAPNFTGLIMGGGWVFRLSERTTFTLDADRSVQESIFENAEYYVATSATLGARQELSPKLAATLKVAVGDSAYNTKQPVSTGPQTKWRTDELLGATCGFDYAIQPWLRVGIDYTYQKRSSNFSEFNYDDNKISGRITVQF